MSYQALDAHADEYDAWFDSGPGATTFAMEVECLRHLLYCFPPPYLEVGAGSGRFSQALGIEYGVEPAPAVLQMAEARGIQVHRGEWRCASDCGNIASESTMLDINCALTLQA